jgi:class 3 adenylate cyclase/tetratricopeptide (TPR) repeat protein
VTSPTCAGGGRKAWQASAPERNRPDPPLDFVAVDGLGGQICAGCGEENPAEARLCGMCGSPLRSDEAAGEVHREVTIVTSDLKGSTALGERLDPEALREVLNRYFSVMRAVFESHGGTIEKIIGDAIVAVFGLPFRHDDDPLRAVEAAAESQRALATLNDELEQGWGVRLVNRTGVATGVVTFGRAEGGQHVLLGEPVDVSTVMEQNAPALEVLLAEATLELVREHVEFDTVGPVSAKGSEATFQGYRLVSVHDRTTEDEIEVPEAAPGLRICPSCGEQSPERMRTCVVCGASLATTIARESRRTVTIVFALPKVHATSGELPRPEVLREVMSRYFEAMRGALERHGGTVEKFIGDAVMAVFGLPVRHEDDAVRAIRAAADMQAALELLNPSFRADHDLELSNHIGVNSGEVIAGDASTAQRLVTGDAVNTAARLEQAASGGEIVLGDLTYRLARDQVEVEFMQPLTLKGKAEPVPAYRLVNVQTHAGTERSHGTPFVGRETEMGTLSRGLSDAIEKRHARLVAVVGDAGVGKSRLIREFATGAQTQARLIRGRCLPYGEGITFWPLAEAIREAAGITNEDSPRVATRRIDRLLARAEVPDREAIVERVAAAINLSPAQFPVSELMWGGRRLLESLAAERPVVLLVDDLHWAEATFLEFIDHLLETVENASILVLGSSRHEISERHAEWTAAHLPMLITLEPLSDADAGRIVEELLGSLEPRVRARIASVAEGNPLYVEQIVSLLVETGAIERGAEGWVATRGSDRLQIPPTVQALVASRLDALKAEERAVVDPASVIGLTFAFDAVSELVDESVRPDIGRDLEGLLAKQLVRQLPDEEVLYRFGHQIIRDTAYGSLLKRSRALLHERFVTWAERVNRERGRELEFEEILGYHLEQAYRYRSELGVIDDVALDIARRAAEKLGSAGRRAFGRGDATAAASLLYRAAVVLPEGAPARIELLAEFAEASIERGEFDAARGALDEAGMAARAAEERRLEARADLVGYLLRLGTTGSVGELEAAVAGIRAVADTLESAGDSAGVARAWHLLSVIEGTAGRYDNASEAGQRAVRYAKEADDARFVARGVLDDAYSALHGPTPVDDAIERCESYLPLIRGNRTAEAIVLAVLAQLTAMSGRFDEARDLSARSRQVVADLGPSALAASLSDHTSRVELLAGDPEAAERELRRDYEVLAAMNEAYFRSTIGALLGRVLWTLGRHDEAVGYARISRDLADADDIYSQVLWRAVEAKYLARAGSPDEAVALGREALTLVDKTVDIELKADTLIDLAEVVALAGREQEQGPHIREALALYREKGDLILAAAAAERLAALEGVAAG